jgi:thioesterase domain-containing protein
MNEQLQPFPFVSVVCEPQAALGTIVYFHPGGLPSACAIPLTAQFPDWRICIVELMLCQQYLLAVDKQGGVNHSIETISAQIGSQLQWSDQQPLMFIGWSFGGVIAYQLAATLCPDKQPLLVLLDSIAPMKDSPQAATAAWSRKVITWFIQYLQALKHCVLQTRWHWWWQHNHEQVLQDLLTQVKQQGAFAVDTGMAGFRKVFQTFTQGLTRNMLLLTLYQPPKYGQPVLLIRARQGMFRRFRWIRHMGWRGLVQDLQLAQVDANHYQMIAEPEHLASLSQLILNFYQHYRPTVACSAHRGL